MSLKSEHPGLFKSAWLDDPERHIGEQARRRGIDARTAEMAGWCAEIHAHVSELAGELGLSLVLMGGNGTALRLEATKQRGSRDNDYLTPAGRGDIKRLMQILEDRFSALAPAFVPQPHLALRTERLLPSLVAYRIPVLAQLRHGAEPPMEVKLDFHTGQELPPCESISAALGPARETITASLPTVPHQIALKLMPLAPEPVGAEPARAGVIPHHMYDLDQLLPGIEHPGDWTALADYAVERYQRELEAAGCDREGADLCTGVARRLDGWADCLDRTSAVWKDINRCQDGQIDRSQRLGPWGWRGRALRLKFLIGALALGGDGFNLWRRANQQATEVPDSGARSFKTALARAACISPGDVTVAANDFHGWVWEILTAGDPELTVGRLEEALE